MVGISTEAAEPLRQSLGKLAGKNKSEFPFPLVADPTLSVFKAFRAYDDFERIPLHGTFLIDGQGRVRWREISFEPFTNAAFVLSEAERLLKLPPANLSLVRISR